MIRAAAIALLLACVPSAALAQTVPPFYALKITNPSPVDTAVNEGRDADNRIYFAYPGLEYRVPTVVHGGCYPFTYSLSGHPAWLSINATTGILSGTPTDTTLDDDASITVQVTDACSASDTVVWGIDVSTTVFRFVMQNGNDTTGTGLIGAPYATLNKIWDASVGATRITYLGCTVAATPCTFTVNPTGTWTTEGADPNHRYVFAEADGRSTQWLEYPGHTVTINLGHSSTIGGAAMGCDGFTEPCTGDEDIPHLRLQSNHVWVGGLMFTNGENIVLEFIRSGSFGATVFEAAYEGLWACYNGGNGSFLFWPGSVNPTSWGDSATWSSFDNFCGGPKFYYVRDVVFAHNTLTTARSGEAIATKESVDAGSIRANSLGTNGDPCAEEGMAGDWGDNEGVYATTFAIEFNNFACDVYSGGNSVLRVRRSEHGLVYIWRNTFQGRILVDDLSVLAGPVVFRRNVFETADTNDASCPATTSPPLHCIGTVTASRLEMGDNLTCSTADNCVTDTGVLQGSYLTAHGPASATPKGHMLSAATTATPARLRFRVAQAFFDRVPLG